MKAKDTARQVNQAVEEAGLQARWDALKARLAAGESFEDASVVAEAAAIQEQVDQVIKKPSTDYLDHLFDGLAGLGAANRRPNGHTVRAAVFAADQAWRAYRARLSPLPARLVDVDALRRHLTTLSPHIAALAWGGAPAPTGGPAHQFRAHSRRA